MELFKFLRSNIANIISLSTIPFALCAFYYIFIADFFFSFLFINIAFFLDTLDGYFARKLKIESEIGRLIDSFCDILNYLIYPALLIFVFFRFDIILSLVLASFIVVFGIARLARFTSEGFVVKEGKNYYKGLPVPVALYGTALCYVLYQKLPSLMTYLFPIIVITFSLLMVSSVRVKKINNIYWYLLVLISLLFLSLTK